jgi:hypothetical protein
MTPAQFLFYKIKVAFIYSLLANSPVMLALGIFYPEHIPVMIICFLLGMMYLTLSITIKYDTLAEQIVLIVCLIFPPLLAVMVPYMSNRATKQLKRILK